MAKSKKITVNGTEIFLYQENAEDFISLTDIARYRDVGRSDYVLQNWMRNRSTIDFIGLWEQFNNPDFNSIEFDGIKNMAGSNSFSLTPKRWIEATNAIGIVSKTGRYGGTFAHKDIAFEFASWLSAWREENSEAKGNIRDHASLEQLVVLSNMESINSIMIHQGLDQSKRLLQLNRIAITQMKSLIDNKKIRNLK